MLLFYFFELMIVRWCILYPLTFKAWAVFFGTLLSGAAPRKMRAHRGYTSSIHNAATGRRGELSCCCCCPLESPPEAVQDKWLSRSPWPGRGELEMEELQDLISFQGFSQPTQVSEDGAAFTPGLCSAAGRQGQLPEPGAPESLPHHWALLSNFSYSQTALSCHVCILQLWGFLCFFFLFFFFKN